MSTPFENTVKQLVASGNTITNAKTLYAVGRENGMTCKQVKESFITEEFRVGRGQYSVSSLLRNIPGAEDAESTSGGELVGGTRIGGEMVIAPPAKTREFRPMTVALAQKTFEDVEEVFIPPVDPTFVAWGEYADILSAIRSGMFFPIFISGLSGGGKTIMVEQACAKAKREYVRVQISPETDETDLIGGFRLVDGETVFYKGPVIKAMERGAVLLVDELDRGSNKIMCLQGVMEGKPVLLKKIGQVVNPAPGFTVIATANTKGRGSEDGRYSAAGIIDEAFLERFPVTIDQDFPNDRIERNILLKHMTAYGVIDDEFADKLVAWSSIIRKTFESDGVDELISTRRLCHIVKTYSIYKDRLKSISKCIARFDDDTRAAFSDLYTKINGESAPVRPEVDNVFHDDDSDEIQVLTAVAFPTSPPTPPSKPLAGAPGNPNIPF